MNFNKIEERYKLDNFDKHSIELSEDDDKIEDKNKNISLMKGFYGNIEKETLENTNYRKVLYTGKHSQLVLMSLKPGEDIGEEIHPNIDQFFRFESGNGKAIVNNNEYQVKDGDSVIVPAGSKHNIINLDEKEDLKIYTIYSPPKHKDGIIRATKEDAEDAENKEEFDGETTEKTTEVELTEDGEGAMATLDAVSGMGAPVIASRGVTGSGDIPSLPATKKKKKIKRVKTFEEYLNK